jgi:hypothetical protein
VSGAGAGEDEEDGAVDQIWLWGPAAVLIVAVLAAALVSARGRSAEPSPDTADTTERPADPADPVQADPVQADPVWEEVSGQCVVAPEPTDAAAPPTGDSALAALDAERTGGAALSTFGTAASVVADAVTRPGPYPGSALPAAVGSSPSAEYPIKANTGAGRFYPPESPYFVRTRADLWFRTAAAAEAAGFTASNTRTGAT